MKSVKILFLVSVACLMAAACDPIGENERLVYVEPEASEPVEQDTVPDPQTPEPTQRVVLLEDFTGQKCANCPKGTEIIEQLTDSLGDALVAVGIHCGPLGVHPTAKAIGLATDLGDAYYDYWELEFQPVGLVNRHGAVNYTNWVAEVKKELARPAPMRLTATATYSEAGDMDVTIQATGTAGTTTGKLQVWVLEDSITATQLMPDNTRKQDYVHNHVLRQAVNGPWGDDITVTEGKTTVCTYTLKLEEGWRKEQLSIVAFIYDGEGVQQAVKTYVARER
jgi:hypothetical protein